MITPLPGQAHTRLIDSEPQHNATLAVPPPHVLLKFSAPPEDGFTTIQISPAQLEQWQSLEVHQQSKQVEAKLPALGQGRYKIRWSVLSRDGHRQRGVFEFSID